jgi:hypothetical protein
VEAPAILKELISVDLFDKDEEAARSLLFTAVDGSKRPIDPPICPVSHIDAPRAGWLARLPRIGTSDFNKPKERLLPVVRHGVDTWIDIPPGKYRLPQRFIHGNAWSERHPRSRSSEKKTYKWRRYLGPTLLPARHAAHLRVVPILQVLLKDGDTITGRPSKVCMVPRAENVSGSFWVKKIQRPLRVIQWNKIDGSGTIAVNLPRRSQRHDSAGATYRNLWTISAVIELKQNVLFRSRDASCAHRLDYS